MIDVNKDKRFQLSKMELYDLGITEGYDNLRIFDTVADIKMRPPNVVLCKCLEDVIFTQNNFKKQRLYKNQQYICGLGVYIQLRIEPRKNKRILKPSNIKFKNVYKPYNGQDLTNKTIFFWRTGGIGDLLFINPIIRHLKQKYPSCKIKFACGPQYQSMLQLFDDVDKICDLPFPIDELFSSDYHAIFEGIIERTKQAQTENAYRLFSKYALNLDIPTDELHPILKQQNEDETNECKQLLKDNKINKFILIQLNASSPIRTPSPKFWKSLIERLIKEFNDYKIIFIDSPHRGPKIDLFIDNNLNQYKDKVFNFAPHSKTLSKGISMASLSDLIIATDSAMMHIGAALGKKIFGIYGPFPGHIRLSTYNNCDWIESTTDICKCAPCFRHGQSPCPNSRNEHSICYDLINIDNAIEKIKNLMAK